MHDDDTEYTYLPPSVAPPLPPTALERARRAMADAETLYAAAEHSLQLAAHYAAVAQAEAITRIATTLDRLAMPKPIQFPIYRHHNED